MSKFTIPISVDGSWSFFNSFYLQVEAKSKANRSVGLKTNSSSASRKRDLIGDLIWRSLIRARRKRAIRRSFRISCLGRVLLSLSTAYPKGITFPLGSCLSRTNSRNSSPLLPVERSSRQFFAAERPYQLLARVVPSAFANLDFAAARHAQDASYTVVL